MHPLHCPFMDKDCTHKCGLAVIGESQMITIDDREVDYYACAIAIIAQSLRDETPEQLNAQCREKIWEKE